MHATHGVYPEDEKRYNTFQILEHRFSNHVA
jgi:hypothetical protein